MRRFKILLWIAIGCMAILISGCKNKDTMTNQTEEESQDAFFSSVIDKIVSETEEEKESETEMQEEAEEIQIPEIVSAYKKKNTQRKRIIRYEKLPEIKKPVKKKNKEPVKKLIILALIAILLVILFVISAVLHSGNDDNQSVLAIIYGITDFIYSYGGAIINGCPNG